MNSRLTAMLLGCVLAACGVGGSPDGKGGGGGGGTGGGDGSGGGSGSGSGSGSGGGGSTDTSYVEPFLTGMAMKYCDEAFTCKASFPTDAGVTFEQAFGTSAMQCYADAAAQNMPAQVAAEITAGKIIWNPTDAMACLSGFSFGTCTEFWQNGGNAPAACATALVGTVADGGACVVDFDCMNASSYCDATSKKCTVDTGMRTVPEAEIALRMQWAIVR